MFIYTGMHMYFVLHHLSKKQIQISSVFFGVKLST